MSHFPEPSPTPRPPRRKRYAGKYPHRFEEKYKELAPEAYPDTIAKVLASGKTPAGSHVPILVAESIAALQLEPGQIIVDCTLGRGGHTAAFLTHIKPSGRVIGFDVDAIEQAKTITWLAKQGFDDTCFTPITSNYAGLQQKLHALEISAVDAIFADLGCSSMQYDNPKRGFSYKTDGPLDMRLNPTRGISAAQWLAKQNADQLEKILRENADEDRAAEISHAIAQKSFSTTRELRKAIEQIGARWREDDLILSLKRTFQAIRIAVNDEFSALDALLRQLPHALKPGGRVAILTFHSGEDRRVKKAFQAHLQQGLYREISENVITANFEERHHNPRSASAKLRWAIRENFTQETKNI